MSNLIGSSGTGNGYFKRYTNAIDLSDPNATTWGAPFTSYSSNLLYEIEFIYKFGTLSSKWAAIYAAYRGTTGTGTGTTGTNNTLMYAVIAVLIILIVFASRK